MARSSAMSARFVLVTRASGSTTATKPPPPTSLGPSAESKPIKAYLDFKYFRDNLSHVQSVIEKRKARADVTKAVALYEEYVNSSREADQMRKRRNEIAKEMKGKIDPDKRTALVEEGKMLKAELALLEETVERKEEEMLREGLKIPNDLHPDAPVGSEDVFSVIKMVGKKPTFDFPIKDHLKLGEDLGLVDFEGGAKVSGPKFYYLKNGAALLELALVNWTMQRLVSRGFTPLITPDLVRSRVVEGCGFQPRGDNTQVYSVANMDLCLIGTAEISVGGLLQDTTIATEDLPLKLVAFSHCFRTEAGAAGQAGRGLYRVHQFSKVEMFAVTRPEDSEAMHLELRQIEEDLFSELGLHFQVLDMASEDLGAPAYRKYDVEAWMPGLDRYGEISSTSNCTDYQSRRLNIRYKAEDGTRFVHTLNGTACAVPRMIVSILENFQQEDGSVIVPEPLRPFMGGMDRLVPKR
eukprot:CAMPEP_0184659454 /NCGR_PEP_ID=MMETSP0308-20130426/29648_1 /TAXON_ID=38269 /ORGANISM="Gloeochaete witrockiana, Strain SAG 46.84" /LENGTH=465 /DNA_ID=CAMNT_0027099277 /DNA_START=167 /DNA_END=1564 /DNA_ORIENTATION=+